MAAGFVNKFHLSFLFCAWSAKNELHFDIRLKNEQLCFKLWLTGRCSGRTGFDKGSHLLFW
jgi:hypothetical protein